MKREVAIRFSYEADDGSLRENAIVFDGTEAFKVTYYDARDASMLEAYDRIVDRGQTTWLAEVVANLRRKGHQANGLVHLMISFDDSPCYEFLCTSFRVEDPAEAVSR
ncbi:MAG TPA: hypothetical protein VHQ90_13110 [Thermoanaerobaculia bacterium]|nr:hypothetical protein [Thermoanaerobaculia bacterium]